MPHTFALLMPVKTLTLAKTRLEVPRPDQRVPLMRAFAPGRIRDLEKNIRSFAIELIEAVKDHGRCDFLDKVAEPLPIFIFMKLMGFDTARYREFREWAVAMSQPRG